MNDIMENIEHLRNLCKAQANAQREGRNALQRRQIHLTHKQGHNITNGQVKQNGKQLQVALGEDIEQDAAG